MTIGATARQQRVSFTAPEYQADGTIRPARYGYAGSAGDGWEITREGRPHLRLGPGYRLLRTSHCGICATDLARRHLPFRLPQITGHEVVAIDDAQGAAVAVEINASHAARGVAPAAWCSLCRAGLHTHCPERIVLGIHDLPGGFAPWILAPVAAVVAIPDSVSAATATLIEPFAAAMHAVQTIAPADGARVALLGPRRLGSLVIAALAAWRRSAARRIEIVAVTRRPELGPLARDLGADDVLMTDQADRMENLADVVVDTTGNPAALPLAIRLARTEVHVKSTTGQQALGLAHLTEMVVDEISLCSWAAMDLDRAPSPPARTAVVVGEGAAGLAEAELRARGIEVFAGSDPGTLVERVEAGAALPLGGADLAVVTSRDMIDAVIRPCPGREHGLVRPRGAVYVMDVDQERDVLLAAVLGKGLRFTTSRCGDLRAAVELLADPRLGLGETLGDRMVTDIIPAPRLEDAFARAAGADSIKVVAAQPHGMPLRKRSAG